MSTKPTEAVTADQFQEIAAANPDALREFVSRAVAQRVNALRGINAPADFILAQVAKGHDVTQAKAELADVLTNELGPDRVERMTAASVPAPAHDKKK